MSNKQKHRWYDVIVAWANGEKIQVRSSKCKDMFSDFVIPEGLSITPSFSSDEWEWRVKPKANRRLFRLALVSINDKKTIRCFDVTETHSDSFEEYGVYKFIRWVGDTVEVEVEV